MKNLLIILLTITASFICTSEALAQYSIPSYNVEIVSDPTTFEENSSQSSFVSPTNHRRLLFIQLPGSEEERKMIVRVLPPSGSQSATATFKIYSLDGEDTMGPFSINEQSTFEQAIDEREWGVSVLSASEGAEMSVWIE